ncbi:hypothetical protein FE257_009654 [Aspergillus nanangensis]|uniref:Serine hydrolase domain-containing protein n=1 Tax=Aspergillus nanangensis TaxID=2582783 RepID=A0AAD4CJQ1_ASPNN|nr:hypothetical protein FE257_009654 [Aspergillus nanangensis]
MAIKILCLHGQGTSGAIFKSQTSSIRSRLTDLNITYDFLDGPFPCAPAPGVDLFYPPPYQRYLEDSTLSSAEKALTWLHNYLAQNGPYDAILTFSQGCAVGAAALLVHQQSLQPQQPPLFKAAIFICGGIPIPILEKVGYHVSPAIKARDLRSREMLAQQADSRVLLERGAARWTGAAGDVLLGGLSTEEIRGEMMDGPVRIGIPTVHVYGAKDPRFGAGVWLSGVCEGGSKRRVFDHGGGHEIPRTEEVSATVAGLVRWVLKEGGVCS